MVELTYQDESPGDLRFHLVRGRVCPSRFTVVAEGIAQCGPALVEARIIGASHAIVYHLADEQFTEILACSGPQSFGESLLTGAVEQVEQGLETPLNAAVSYRVRAQVFRGGEACRQLAELEAQAANCAGRPGGIGLRFAFPRRGGEDVQAVTALYASVRGKGTVVRTAHAYPQADACVMTEAHIEPKLAEGESPR